MPSPRTILTTTAAFTAVVAFAAGSYQPPVDAPVVDAFRPPATPWAAGNRGIDYATAPGTRVGAAADGTVVFAGPVGGTLHVVVRHADGVRTSYSFLRTARVHRGDRVVRGEPVGTTGNRFHFGARVGEVYVDPTLLFGGGGPPRVHLVPDRDAAGTAVGSGPHPAALRRGRKPW